MGEQITRALYDDQVAAWTAVKSRALAIAANYKAPALKDAIADIAGRATIELADLAAAQVIEPVPPPPDPVPDPPPPPPPPDPPEMDYQWLVEELAMAKERVARAAERSAEAMERSEEAGTAAGEALVQVDELIALLQAKQ